MKVSIASDHAGFEMKQKLIAYLEGKSIEVVDCGPDSDDRCDYPDYAAKGCAPVVSGEVDYGILVCGTGIGMAIAACKIDGIRAANCNNTTWAELCREHNNANVITLSARYVTEEENQAILNTFSGWQLSCVYSIVYNACYMLPEIVLTAVVGAIITRIPQIAKKL